MKIHELKSWPTEFEAVRQGDKTHEVRVNDRDFKEGDVLHLCKYVPDNHMIPRPGRYTGDELIVRVTNITRGPDFGLPTGMCCMSIKLLAWELVG